LPLRQGPTVDSPHLSSVLVQSANGLLGLLRRQHFWRTGGLRPYLLLLLRRLEPLLLGRLQALLLGLPWLQLLLLHLLLLELLLLSLLLQSLLLKLLLLPLLELLLLVLRDLLSWLDLLLRFRRLLLFRQRMLGWRGRRLCLWGPFSLQNWPRWRAGLVHLPPSEGGRDYQDHD
jgi:hypothetical protein